MILSHCITSVPARYLRLQLTYRLIGIGHQLLDQPFLQVLLALSADHVSTCLIEGVDLLRSQIASDLAHCPHDLVDEGLVFAGLQGDEMSTALVSDFDEGITSHILDAFRHVSQGHLQKRRGCAYLRGSRA